MEWNGGLFRETGEGVGKAIQYNPAVKLEDEQRRQPVLQVGRRQCTKPRAMTSPDRRPGLAGRWSSSKKERVPMGRTGSKRLAKLLVQELQ